MCLFMQSILVHKVVYDIGSTCACLLERAGLTVSIFKVAAVQVVTKNPAASVRVSHLSGQIDVEESKKKAKNKITSQMSLAVKGTDSPPEKMVSLDIVTMDPISTLGINFKITTNETKCTWHVGPNLGTFNPYFCG